MSQPVDFWNNRYNEEEAAYGLAPNEYFAAQIDKLKPGKILLAAEGQGRNALYALRLGWKVWAFDFSVVAKERALKFIPTAYHIQLIYDIGDANELTYPSEFFDAIGLIYSNFATSNRAAIHSKLQASLKPKGCLVFESFSAKQLAYQQRYQSGGPNQLSQLFTPEMLEHEFPEIQFEILKQEEISLAEGKYHSGLAHVVRAFGTKK